MTCAIGATRAEKAHVSPFRLDEPSPPCWGRFFMEIPARCLAFLCVLFLTACGSSDASLREESGEAAPKSRFPLAGVSVDDLYFEAVRLHSRGLLSREKMDALQRSLDQMDETRQGETNRSAWTSTTPCSPPSCDATSRNFAPASTPRSWKLKRRAGAMRAGSMRRECVRRSGMPRTPCSSLECWACPPARRRWC